MYELNSDPIFNINKILGYQAIGMITLFTFDSCININFLYSRSLVAKVIIVLKWLLLSISAKLDVACYHLRSSKFSLKINFLLIFKSKLLFRQGQCNGSMEL